jgi:hypothetical protein
MIQNIQIILNFSKKKLIFFKNMIFTAFPNNLVIKYCFFRYFSSNLKKRMSLVHLKIISFFYILVLKFKLNKLSKIP